MEDRKVSFTKMIDGSAEDFLIIKENDLETAKDLSKRIINHLKLLENDDGAYKISRLDHCLQAATRAERDGADDEWVFAALLHDIGDILAPFSHAEASYEIIKPFVREEVSWTVKHHGIFQMKYNKSFPEEKRNQREQFQDHPNYVSAIRFVECWDQNSFDPTYDTFSIEHFEPLVERVIQKKI